MTSGGVMNMVFIRLPNLNFSELWNLLEFSKLQENRYGAAYIIETEYPDDLLSYLLHLLNDPNFKINQNLYSIFEILKLDVARNRSKTVWKVI